MGARRFGSRFQEEREDGLREEVIYINRVAKVVKGGRKFGFTALVAIGDSESKVGLGIGKASEVIEAIRKGVDLAKKNMVVIPREGTTIPYEVKEHYCATTVVMKPAREGTGVIAGGPARVIFKLAGITDISAKFLGSNNRANCAKATFYGLKKLKTRRELLARRLKRFRVVEEPAPEEELPVVEAEVESAKEPVEKKQDEPAVVVESPTAGEAGESASEKVGAEPAEVSQESAPEIGGEDVPEVTVGGSEE